MSVKISQLPNLTDTNLLTVANTAVPVVSDVSGNAITYQTTIANVKTYTENNFVGTGTFSAAGIATFYSNVVIAGNLSVQGTTTTTSSQNLSTNASLIEMHTFSANLDPWTTNDGRDIGLRMYYYSTAANTAALYRESSNGFLTWIGAGAGNTAGNISTSATFGDMQLGTIWVANTTATTGARTGALQVNGGAYIGGNIWAGGTITNLGDSYTIGNIVSGNLQANGVATVGSTLTVATGATVNTLTVNNSGTFGTTLVSQGNATINALTVNASAVIGTSLQAIAGIQATPIGNATASSGAFTTLTASSTLGVTGAFTAYSTSTFSGNVNTNNIMPTGNANANIGSTSLQFNTVFAKAASAQYADLAEKYLADATYEPGTVVVFGGSHEITVTEHFADNRVAGVVSTEPAYLMNSSSEGLPVALRGKVPVKVVGSVAKGDLLVTSTTPGYAVSLNFTKPEPYTVVAKSLEDNRATEPRTIMAVIL